MWLGNIIYENREIADEQLDLTADTDRLIYLGPNLMLRRCTLVVRVPASRLLIRPTSFIDCDIELKQELKNFQEWLFASLKGCRFKGRMVGCEFGHRPGFAAGWEQGHIEDCDFTEARLDLCRFHGCDPQTLRLPRWPCFTILDPIERSRELNTVEWPGRFRPVSVEGSYQDPPSTQALTFYAPAEAKRSKTTEEALKAAVSRFDFIVY